MYKFKYCNFTLYKSVKRSFKMKKVKWMFIFTLVMLLSSCGTGAAVKELKKINDNDSRYWSQFIKKNGINAVDADNETVLLYAVQQNNTALIKACIKCGADVNKTTKYPPLLVYPIIYKNKEVVSLFLKNGARIVPLDYNPLKDVIRQSLIQYDMNTEFDNEAKEINKLLFTKITKADINTLHGKSGSYFDYLWNYDNYHVRLASQDVLYHLIKKGYPLKEEDVNWALKFLSVDSRSEFIKEHIDLIGYERAFEVLSNWISYNEKDNEYVCNIFIDLLKSMDDASEYKVSIESVLSRLVSFRYYRDNDYENFINELPLKMQNIVSSLKNKNFNVNECEVVYNDFPFIDKVDSIKDTERSRAYAQTTGGNVEYYDRQINDIVSNIQRTDYFKTLHCLVAEGFPMNTEMSEAYKYFADNYYKN